MKNYLSKLSMVLIGFVGGIAFLISCGSGGSADATTSGQDYYLVDAANVKVGRLISIANDTYDLNEARYAVINSKGYIVYVDMYGKLQKMRSFLVYASANCTGQAYAFASQPNGSIIGSDFERYSIPPDANVLPGFSYEYYRILGEPGCKKETTPRTATVIPAYFNDVSVTGVPTTGYLGTLRVQLL